MNEINFSPFPYIKTKNYCLREYAESDDKNIFILRSDEVVLKYLDHPRAVTIDDARTFIKKIEDGIKNNEWINWAITNHYDNEMLGSICLWNFSEDKRRADIGFALLPQHFGKGIMQEVTPAILDYGFNKMKLDAIDGNVDPDNIKSIKLMEKFGFNFHSKLENTIVYSLSNSNYKNIVGD